MLKVESLRNTRVFQEGREEGRGEKEREMIFRMAALQMPIEQIAAVTQLSVEQIQAILATAAPPV